MEPLETVIIRGQQDLELRNQLNPIEIKIGNDQIINFMEKYNGALHQFTPVGLFFQSSVTNNTSHQSNIGYMLWAKQGKNNFSKW